MNEPRFEHLLFAGAGMSGVACVEELLKSGQIFDITIFGEEPYAIMTGPCCLASWPVSATSTASSSTTSNGTRNMAFGLVSGFA